MARRLHLVLALILGLTPASGATPTMATPLPRLGELDPAVAEAIGRRIWQNEAAGRVDRLVHWLPGEDHLSLGIGHFIWYPAGRRGPFVESFPALLAFLETRGVALPDWLARGAPCPWPDRASFRAAGDGPRVTGLRTFLARTIDHQLAFMTGRLRAALDDMLRDVSPGTRAVLAAQIERLIGDHGAPDPAALYALIDYVNFKGEGIDPVERYRGAGWGLLQVLQTMPRHPGRGTEAFAAAAAEVLRRRVAHAPEERGESRWLAGWLRRVATYPSFEIPEGDGQAARGS